MKQEEPAFYPFIAIIPDSSQIVLYKKRVHADRCRDALLIAAALTEDHIGLTEEIVDRGQDQLDGCGFGVAFEILDDADSLDPVLPRKRILQLENIILFADPHVPFDIIFGDLI